MTTELELAHDRRPAAAPDPIDHLMRYATAIDVAYGFAEKLCGTALVPKNYQGKPGDAAVAILHGAELGLNPIQALSQVFTVHGQPAIYARTMVALLKSRGYRFATLEASATSVTVIGFGPLGQEEESTWTIERAIEAGFVPQIDDRTGEFRKNQYGKLIGNEKYLTQPEEMLWAKAAATVCKRLAPEVLLGINHTAEDLESEPLPVRVQSERADMPAGTASAADVLDDVASEAAEVPQSVKDPDPEPVPEPAAPMSTAEQQKRLSDLLAASGRTKRPDKLTYLSDQLGRKVANASQLTAAEADAQIVELERPVETDSVAEATEDWATAQADLEGTEQAQTKGGAE
ncbi:hypothetical protein [Nocardia sp. NPDC046763]|uniref:hypothetical protein n=1 Tax=Nocardia sp. NPDC046763 TaxID=3155256 RepID=UPI0033EC833E